ncbi:MAG: tetratricopeptide repeat protein [Firmicutes bacterium]|nr:tetratricopeptide repeat protein [Bacillota bacterium]
MFENLSLFYYNKGLQQARESRISTAAKTLVKAVSYDRGNIQAWNLAGLCYYRLGEYKSAAYCWTQSLRQVPENNGATTYLADLQNALEETDPYFSRVLSLCRQQHYRQAAGILSKEICSRFALSAALWNYLGVIHLLSGRTNAAVKCWQTVLSIDKSNVAATRYLEAVEHRLSCKLLKWKEKLWMRIAKATQKDDAER